MALAGLALAGLAWVAGWPAGALGILLGTPIGLINHALTMPLARGRAEDRLTKSLAWRLPSGWCWRRQGWLSGTGSASTP